MPPTPLTSLDALGHLATADGIRYVFAAAFAQMLASVLVTAVYHRPSGAMAAMASNPAFRPMDKSAGMLSLYFPFGAPFVSAFLALFVSLVAFGKEGVSAFSPAEGALWTSCLWLAGSAHGIFLDYATLRIEGKVIGGWLLSSLASALACGTMMGYML
jgi:hypothetical protein